MDSTVRAINSKEDYDSVYITTKSRLLEVISREADAAGADAGRAEQGTYEKRYRETLAAQLVRFYDLIENSYLFEKLDDWWNYMICIGCTGISLYIRYYPYGNFLNEDGSVSFGSIDDDIAMYRLIEMKCGWLTPAEFADACGCAVSTVNVWIRRGKIRSASKFGNRWMIPALTLPVRRNYIDPVYTWETRIFNLPEGFEDLAEPGTLMIRKIRRCRDRYTAYMEKSVREPYKLTKLDVARLETYLIANPQVMYTGDDRFIDR